MRDLVKPVAAWPLLGLTAAQRRLTRPHPEAFRILLFHDVPPNQRAALRRLVAYLKGRGLLISAAEAARRLKGPAPSSGTPGVLLSFDDGFASNVDAVDEVLEPYDAKALFFVCPGLINLPLADQRVAVAKGIFDGRRSTADMPPDLRLMTWDELERLQRAGHTIGNHTLHHRRLAGLPADEIEDEVGSAAVELKRRLGEDGTWMAYPFGDIGSIDATALRVISKHHLLCRSGVRGMNDSRTHRLGLLAEHVDLAAPFAWQRALAQGGLDFRYAEARERLDAYTAAAG